MKVRAPAVTNLGVRVKYVRTAESVPIRTVTWDHVYAVRNPGAIKTAIAPTAENAL